MGIDIVTIVPTIIIFHMEGHLQLQNHTLQCDGVREDVNCRASEDHTIVEGYSKKAAVMQDGFIIHVSSHTRS